MNQQIDEQLRSRVDAARRMGIGLSTLDRLVTDGQIKTVRIRRRRLIPDTQITAFINSQMSGTE